MREEFTRTAMLLGEEAMERLSRARVAVFGIGGVGGYVVEALARSGIGALDIIDCDPDCHVTCHEIFFGEDTAGQLDFSAFDYIADAVDTVTAKLLLIKKAREHNVPIISCMGTGNKLDPTALRVADIYKTSVCPLARVMRYELRKAGIDSLRVVWSDEKPISHPGIRDGETGKAVPGSVSFVPPAAGLIMAGEIIRDISGVGKKH